ncbi:MAG: xylulokinase [Xylanivirga thermophila]|jgi:xylulokinase|uniref:xylulokinase n=1 Tax=Xylanivirga thermophila TaxID=2496273 RepID=UPI0039F643E0
MGYLLGIDIGTSATKTILFDTETKKIKASASSEYPLYQPYIGWAEQDPDDWWRATVSSIQEVLKKGLIHPQDVLGIGLSGQMHGMVLLDKDGNVLRPAIIWCDQRTEEECKDITSIIGREKLISITANPALTNFTATKILWVKKHQPEIFERIHKVLLPKDFIRFKLTGEFASEVSDASGTQLLDVPNRTWSRYVLDKLDIPFDWMPKVYESHEVSGCVTEKVANLTGLNVGTPVVGGAGDQAAGAVGNGIVESGMVSSTIGTSGVVFAYTDKVSIDPKGRVHTFCHAMPDTWHVMGVTQGAGLSLQWFRNNFGSLEKELATFLKKDPYELMTEEAQKADAGCNGLIYLPYLMGERTPHLDPSAKGVFFGISAKHTRNDMIRSIMEGVAYSLRDCLEIIQDMGTKVDIIRASGGGARSSLWRQIQSDIFNRPLSTIDIGEGPALGVALLAGVGTGVYKDVPEACKAAINTKDTIYPIEYNTPIYDRYYEVYRSLYFALKDNYRAIADIEKDLKK